MVYHKFCVLSLLSVVVAAPLKREACAYECGTVCYYQRTINAAVSAGVAHLNSPINSYPHQYQNREGFDLPGTGPWYEFPILHSYKTYTGGSPGADRVIFDRNGNFEAVITHTGESNNGFGECEA